MNYNGILNEAFLQFIWKNQLYKGDNFIDKEGNKIEIIRPGLANTDAGPDFFNAQIKIRDTIWAGNIEIHLKSSDWEKHGHHKDESYDNVILHLVYEKDSIVYNSKGKEVITIPLTFDIQMIESYIKLNHSLEDIPCSNFITKTDQFTLNAWLTNLLIERIEQKTDHLKSILKYTNNNWEETFYIILSRSFGFKVNSEPFEMLAKSLPSIILGKNKQNILQIEALLFGQAGLLGSQRIKDDYFNALKKEYLYLKAKYKLKPISGYLWKFLRIRPVNFPTIRIAQFADLIYKSNHLFSKILEVKDIKSLYQLFNIEAGEYWNNHYNFGKKSESKPKKFGSNARDNIIINTIIPIIFLYGKIKNSEEYMSRTLYFLELIKAEKNKIIKKWESIGLEIKNSYFSQSCIQLYNEYCIKRRCLNCRIGMNYIKYENIKGI